MSQAAPALPDSSWLAPLEAAIAAQMDEGEDGGDRTGRSAWGHAPAGRQGGPALLAELMAAPLDGPRRSVALATEMAAVASPSDALRVLARHGPAAVSAAYVGAPDAGTNAGAACLPPDCDVLAQALSALDAFGDERSAAGAGGAIPDTTVLPEPFRGELGLLLQALGDAWRTASASLPALPTGTTRAQVMRDVLMASGGDDAVLDADTLLRAVEGAALARGLHTLSRAVERFVAFVKDPQAVPPGISWRLETALGTLLVDTTGADDRHVVHDALLVVDIGGNDHYRFTRGEQAVPAVAVLIDHGGDDVYVPVQAGAAPGSAIMGYGVLWDTGGDDRYLGRELTQGAALLGGAVLVDEAGQNVFTAQGFSQGFAMGGIALLLSGQGEDYFHALTHAQGAAGPYGAAALLDQAGDDEYVLGGEAVVLPSAQAPGMNASMGQGAGRGYRSSRADQEDWPGGLGMLVDRAGNDRYQAQVFAQGVGFGQGVGVLIDAGGRNVFDAAWYGMGAGAHRGAGVLLSLGDGDDLYRASHATSIGAAHDASFALFLDRGGNDTYHFRGLGLGGAQADSVAIFADWRGKDLFCPEDEHCSAVAPTAPRAGSAADEQGGGAAAGRGANRAIRFDGRDVVGE